MATTSARTTVPLPDKPLRVGRPRLRPYQKILGRFYEVLFLLKALTQTREEHTPCPPAPSEDIERLRQFGRCLAHLCDTRKGGPTTTAIGIEESDTGYTFWVASNTPTSSAPWLKRCLGILNSLDDDGLEATKGLRQDEFLAQCLAKAHPRISKYKAELNSKIKQVQQMLCVSGSDDDRNLSAWLDVFSKQQTDLQLCSTAYEESKSINMKHLQARSILEKKRQALRRDPFETVKHCIGRLAYHIRIHKRLIAIVEAPNIKNLLDGEVRQLESQSCTPGPERDSHTNLEGILRRTVRLAEPMEEIKNNLLYRHSQCELLDRFVEEYDRFKKQIHAEIQVIEHFYQNGLQFAGNDKYIACSKPACQCCFLYFKFHPARMVVPESHHKIWPHWSLPVIENFQKGDKKSNEQRDILNKIRERLREDLISQILGCSAPPGWHADTLSEISEFDFMRLRISSRSTPQNGQDGEEVEFTDWDLCESASSTPESTHSKSHGDVNDSNGEDSDSETGGVLIRL